MQNLDGDLKQALRDALEGNAAERKACIHRVFKQDGVFSHIGFLAGGIPDIWGIYQIWRFYNVRIRIEVQEILANPEGTAVMVNSLETCWVWWQLPFAFLGGPTVFLHTVFDIEETAQGRVITKQVDHTMWTQSLLFHNLPPFVGVFFADVWRPFVGRAWSLAGGMMYELHHSWQRPGQAPDVGQAVGKHSMHPEKYRQDLGRAIQLGFTGSCQQRRQLARTLYAPDAVFWHPFALVKGAENIGNYFQVWAALNRRIEVDIFGFIVSEGGDRVMVDLEQRVTPWLWPPFLPPIKIWLHIILRLKDGPDGGKLISRHEDHALYVESAVFGNPLGRWYKDGVRPLTGALLGTAGRLAWHVVNWWHNGQPEREFQALMRKAAKQA